MTITEHVAKFEREFKRIDETFDAELAQKKKQDMRKLHSYLPNDNAKKKALEIVFAKIGAK